MNEIELNLDSTKKPQPIKLSEERLFGDEITKQIEKRDDREKRKAEIQSFVPEREEDDVATISAGGYFGQYYDIYGTHATNTKDLILKYRAAAEQPEVDMAIQDIVDETVASLEKGDPVNIYLDDLNYDEEVKEKIRNEFDTVLKMMNFSENGADIFRNWYVDGRLYYHVVVDSKKPDRGIQELRLIDPINIKKVKEVQTEVDKTTGARISKTEREYYVYSETSHLHSPNVQMKGLGGTGVSASGTGTNQGLKVSKESIIRVTSGLMDSSRTKTLSHLHKALKVVNQLRMMEDALVIYRLSRAPERRIFYVDVGNLPKGKAEEYVNKLMSKYRNKIVYDSNTGNIKDQKHHMSMMEDFWLPRREGGRGTEIDTLPGGCLAMNTKVPLLDGRELSIDEIADEMNNGKTLWTYSCDPKTGAIAPGLISWAGVTQKSAKVMRLTLDNGEQVTCTLDHKFPVWNKGFVEAKDLGINDSIIPFNTRKRKINSNNKNKLDYEQVFDNELKQWIYTHRMVRDIIELPHWNYNYDFNEDVKNVVHHLDHNRHNNSPENLVMMGWKDHSIYHADHAGFPPHAANLGGKASAERLKKLKRENPDQYKTHVNSIKETMEYLWSTNEFRSKVLNSMEEYWSSLDQNEKEYRAEVSKKNFFKGTEKIQELLSDPEYKEWYCKRISSGWTDEMRSERSQFATELNNRIWNDSESGQKRRQRHKDIQKLNFNYRMLLFIVDLVKDKTTHQVTLNDVVNELNNSEEMLELLKSLNNHKNVPNWNINCGYSPTIVNKIIKEYGYKDGWREFRKNCNQQNHRIVAIEYLPDEIEVGTLTIDQNHLVHDFHTFALSAGVFTKNSNLGDIEDILFFQKKLYKSLNIPETRLEPEQMFTSGRTTDINRDEVKFQKFINRLRKKFSYIFLDALKIQLQLKGVVSETDWEDIVQDIKIDFVKDNHFYELKDYEILQDRLNILRDLEEYVGTYYSRDWVRKNLLQMTDEDIQKVKKQIEEEKKEGEIPDEEEGGGGRRW